MSQPTLGQRVTGLEARMDDVEPRVATIETELKAFRIEVRQEFAAVRTEMTASGERIREELRKEIRDGDEETRRYMRVLHEDLVERISKIGERSRPPNGRRRSRKD
jgi:hypothetical protein